MAALQFALILTCFFCDWAATRAYAYCHNGAIKNRCETHGGCNPENMCRTCECYLHAWDCSYGGYPDCTTDFEYLDLGTFGNSTYLYSMRRKTWNDAKNGCEAKGGKLIILETHSEADALKGLIEKSPKYTQSSNIFIGAYSDEAKAGPWFWVDGSSVSRANPRWLTWYLKNPYGEGPHCARLQLAINARKYKWDVTRCAYRQHYICETTATEN